MYNAFLNNLNYYYRFVYDEIMYRYMLTLIICKTNITICVLN